MTLIHRKYVGEEFWFDPDAEDFHIVKSEHCGEISWHVWDASHRGRGPYATLEAAHAAILECTHPTGALEPTRPRGAAG